MTDTTPITLLGEAFHFTAEDLRSNRNGRLSVRQRRYLMRRFLNTLLLAAVLLLFPPIAVALVLLWTDSGSVFSTEVLISLLLGAIIAGFFAVANGRRLALVIDLMRGLVRAANGKVNRHGLYLHIGRRRFLLEEASLDLIQSGLRYTFYYLPRSGQVVSVEFAE